MSILVTGATGLVGSVLTRQLVEAGEAVRILRRDTSKLDLLGPTARHIEHAIGDVTDAASVTAAMQGVRHVYHVAAYIGFGGRKDRERLTRINVGGTANVLNAALAVGTVERIVHTSSIAALGRPANHSGLIDETMVWESSPNNTLYAISKHEAELEVHRGIAEGLDVVMVNPSLIFGPGRPGENTQAILDQVRDGKLPAIPVGSNNVVDVEDVAAGHRLAMTQGATGERYILGSENLTWRDIIHTIAEAYGVAPPKRTLSPTFGHAVGAVFEGVSRVTGIRPLLTRETVRAASTVHAYSNHKAVQDLGCTFRPFRETASRLALR